MRNCLRTYFKITWLVILLAFCCTGCKNAGGHLTKKDAGAPYSDWEKCKTGSAKYLDGDTLLVSIFLDDVDALWTSKDRELICTNLDAANKFLVEQGKRYGKEVNLIYDFNKHPDLEFHLSYNKHYPTHGFDYVVEGGEAKKEVLDMLEKVYTFIHEDVPIEKLMKEYGVNSIGFLVYVDHESSVACTYSFDVGGHPFYYPEVCFLNNTWASNGDTVRGSTFAHEILHLFGARDLYCAVERYGVTTDAVEYAYDNCEKDIMLGHYRKGVDWEKKVSGEISEVTAYFLGWRDSSKMVDKFKTMRREDAAVFNIAKNNKGVYTEPKITGRLRSQKNFVSYTVEEVLVVFVVGGAFVMSYRRTKKKTGYASANQTQPSQPPTYFN